MLQNTRHNVTTMLREENYIVMKMIFLQILNIGAPFYDLSNFWYNTCLGFAKAIVNLPNKVIKTLIIKLMSRTLTKLILFVLLCFNLTIGHAQQWLGRTTGNYTGTYGIYNNASSIADSKYKYYFNLWGRGVNFYNNYLTYNAPIKLNHWANDNLYAAGYKDYTGKMQIGNDWFKENLNGKNKQFSFNQDIWGPAFMFPISRNWNMSINTRQRSSLQFIGISEDAARMAKNGIDSNKFAGINNKFSANVQSYQELSFTLGGILAKNDNHQLNGGLTVKFIRGLGAAYFKGDQLSINGTSNTSADVSGNFQYAYTDDQSVISPFNDPYGLFSLNSRGAGAGFDLGLSYTYRSQKLKYKSKWACDRNDRKSDYDFKLSMALNDIGGVRYNRHSTLYNYGSTTNTSINASKDILNGFSSISQNGFDSIGNAFGRMGAAKSSGFTTSLPSAFNLQADIRFSKHFYTALYWNQSLKGYNTTGMRSTSMLSIIPRIESKGFEFSMPLTLSENYKNFYVGAYTRIGPVFFGSDNLGGLLNVSSNSEFRGADIYGGISIGIGHCHSWWYNNNVDPVYMDSMHNDSIKKQIKDTIKIVKHDTITIKDTIKIIKRDTVYSNKKPVKDNTIIEKEAELKKKEADLNKRKIELDAKEKEILAKQKSPVTETIAIKECNTKNNTLNTENTALKNKVNNQADEIATLKKQLEDANRVKTNIEIEKQKCAEDKIRNNAEILKLQDDLIKANKKVADLQVEIDILKKAASNKTDANVIKGSDAEKLLKANKQVDSLKLVILYLESDIEKCKKNSLINNAEVLKKAELDVAKAKNEANAYKKSLDSLNNILNFKIIELDNCKKNSTLNNAEVVKKAEVDKAKAQNDALVYKKRVDSLNNILNLKIIELDNCKKNSTLNNAEVIKKAEADKAKAENDAKIAKKQSDSLSNILIIRTTEYENCKKNSTLNSAEIVKKAEADKAKAENNAKVAQKRADSLEIVLAQRNIDYENCKKNSTQNDAEVQKMQKCADENATLKLEMADMSKTIGKLNAKNYALSIRIDSLLNALKDCSKNSNSGSNNDAELLKQCQNSKAELEAEIVRLKAVISNKNKTLDSLSSINAEQSKKQIELNAQITKLNSEITTLKSNSTNCDDIQKQLDDKNAELNKLKNDYNTIQNQLKTVNAQFNEYKNEYNFLLKQNNTCKMQLDSCQKGLYHSEPGGNPGGSNGGPFEGSIENEDSNSSAETNSSAEVNRTSRGLELGVQILGAIINGAIQNKTTTNNGNSGSSSGSSSSTNKQVETNTNSNSNSNAKNTSTAGDGEGTGKKPSSSSNTSNSDRDGNGANGSTRRR